ncbi:MAG: hypothetical protein ACJ76X_05955 [Solirubrobacteraceae bacterium]
MKRLGLSGRLAAASSGQGPAGWTTNVSGGSTEAPDRIGTQDTTATVDATKQIVTDGLKAEGGISLTQRIKMLVDRCPDSDGTVPGDGANDYELTFRASSHEGSAVANARIRMRWTYLGHVDDQGIVRTFDVKLNTTVLVEGGIRGDDGKLYSEEPPRLYVINGHADGIDPNHPQAGVLDASLGGRATAMTFLGHIIWQDDTAPGLWDMTRKLFAFQALEVADLYKEAQAYWQTANNCVKVGLSAPTTNVRPGETLPLTATVTGPPQKGKGLAAGRFTAIVDAGALAPGSGSFQPGRSIALSLTAPGHGAATARVTTQSRQGKGADSLTFNTVPPTYGYTVQLNGTGYYHEDDAVSGGSNDNTTYAFDTGRGDTQQPLTFSAVWHDFPLPSSGGPWLSEFGAQTGSMGGPIHFVGHHTDNQGTQTADCVGTVDPASLHSIKPGTATAAGLPLSFTVFTDLLENAQSVTCSRLDSWWGTSPFVGNGNLGLGDITQLNANQASITVTPSQESADSFTVNLHNPALPGVCQVNQPGLTCSHTLSWQATVRFTKTSVCTKAGGGYGCQPIKP